MTIKLISKDDDFGGIEYFASHGGYVHFFAGDEIVTLYGEYKISDLEIILTEMKRHLTSRAGDTATLSQAGKRDITK
jgi:hypothetical protein